MDLKEMQQKLLELKHERQEKRMNDILNLVEVLLEESNKSDYITSDNERETFGKILRVLKNMEGWF